MNFDVDPSFRHARVLVQMSRAMSSLACGRQLPPGPRPDVEGDAADAYASAVALQLEAVEWMCAMTRSVMDAAATVQLMSSDTRSRKMSQVATPVAASAAAPAIGRRSSVSAHAGEARVFEEVCVCVCLCLCVSVCVCAHAGL